MRILLVSSIVAALLVLYVIIRLVLVAVIVYADMQKRKGLRR